MGELNGRHESQPEVRMTKEIRMMNLERAKQGQQLGAADVSSAELLPISSAGRMPAAPWGAWSHLRHF
jgi:hypothetical protein